GEHLRQAAHEYFTRRRLAVTYMHDKERSHE
ncbi:MAG: hypothetical protein K0S77_2960, partial [Pseudomonas sp.]|nr:hypothetical protein [Pseudomonas sp.]